MVFSSLYFLYFFFPVIFFAHLIAPQEWKNLILLLSSIYFYAWGEPVYVVLLLFSAVFNYVVGLDIARRTSAGQRKQSLLFGILVNILLLGFFKYYGFCVEIINTFTPFTFSIRELALPIGISFYTFQALSYIVDVYRKTIPAQQSLLQFAVYLTMFPQLVAGPIVKYTDIEAQLTERRLPFFTVAQGAERLVIGLGKKVLIANNLGLLYTSIQAMPERSLLTAWIGITAYTLQIYFDFSGYSDMAIGMGHMLGFTFPENFSYPYMAKSVSEFWRRWHMTLSFWFRDYVYIPLGGSRVGTVKQMCNILIVWMLTGLWHGASWNFVLWGCYYGVILLLEKFVLRDMVQRLPAGIQHGYTMILVMLGWGLFSHTQLRQAGRYIGNLFGIGVCGIVDAAAWYQLHGNLLLLLLATVCCTPLVKRFWQRLIQISPKPAAVGMIVLFLLSTAYLVSNSYNPFLYFRF